MGYAFPWWITFFAFPTKRFRCSWFGIVAHSGQSIFFLFLILGLVLGIALLNWKFTELETKIYPGVTKNLDDII